MRHFSCDLCGKAIVPGQDARYVVRMDVAPAGDPTELTAADLDSDHVAEMAEMLEAIEAGRAIEAPAPGTLEFDLCRRCHRTFSADPLGRSSRRWRFSSN